jgi:hypothetical protein
MLIGARRSKTDRQSEIEKPPSFQIVTRPASSFRR